jgi:hypothetical protein
MVALQKAALALFDILDVPVWGNADEAANRLAGYLMTQFGDQIAWKTLMGSAWYLAQTTMTGAGADFYYVRDPEARRFYGILCMAYASDPEDVRLSCQKFGHPEPAYRQMHRGLRASPAGLRRDDPAPCRSNLAAEGAGNVVASPRQAPVTSILRNLGRPMRGSMERFLNYLCLGYGNEPDQFMDLADKFLKARARRCTDEYQQVEKAFTKTVLPYVDPSMLQEVRARRWFAPSMYEWR